MSGARRLVVGPFNRVEGDLEVRLEVADGAVRSAQVVAPMYRGFEQMLVGRDPLDALTIVPRICGICSVSQSVAATRALAQLGAIEPPPNGELATRLLLATENLADHLTHFHLFFMPDFGRPVYAGRPWFDEARRRFAALTEAQPGSSLRAALAARQRWFELVGTLGGKWPHTMTLQPGGSARAVRGAERGRLLARLHEMRAFLEDAVFGGTPLESMSELADAAALQRWAAADPRRGSLRLFLEIAADLGLDTLGRGPGLYLSFGQPPVDGGAAPSRGLWDAAARALLPLQIARVAEDATHAWMADGGRPVRAPTDGLTLPDADKPGAYTWNKAPRWDGRVLETGALARQLVGGHPLLHDIVARSGGTVFSRVLARVLEMAQIVPRMAGWLDALRLGEPFFDAAPLPDHGAGIGLVEAARGALGHWVRVRGGRIESWQIVAPTTWNFSPRDAAGIPGALEQALVGTPVREGETTPVAVQHVVRSFDPCMVCTVH